MDKQYHVYIMTNPKNTVLYTGITNNLPRRVYEHKNKMIDSFTKRYNVTKLVYFDACLDVHEATNKEKQIKAGSRMKKIGLINSMNPEWKDLSVELDMF